MVWIVGLIIVYFLFLKPSTIVNTSFTTTGGGGTSTPTPAPELPAFYQESNSAPTSSNNPTPVWAPSPPINNPIMLSSSTGGNIASPTSNPNADITINNENTSNGQEQDISYANNGIGGISKLVPIVKSPGQPFGPPRLIESGTPIFENNLTVQKTIDSPSAVGTPPAGTGLHPAATIAPLPVKSPGIEATVKTIANNVLLASQTQENSLSLQRQTGF